MGKIFSLEHLGLERHGIGIKVPGLIHEDNMVSMASGGYFQPSFLGKSNRSLVNCVTTLVMISISLEEITA